MFCAVGRMAGVRLDRCGCGGSAVFARLKRWLRRCAVAVHVVKGE